MIESGLALLSEILTNLQVGESNYIFISLSITVSLSKEAFYELSLEKSAEFYIKQE